jgi:hypothetical protein
MQEVNIGEICSNILSTAFLEVGEDNVLVRRAGPESEATRCTDMGKALYLSGDGVPVRDDRVYLHPLLEPLSGVPQAVTWAYGAWSLAHQVKLMALINQVMTFGASTADHEKSTPKAKNLLLELGEVTPTALKNSASLMSHTLAAAGDKVRLIKYSLKQDAVLDGKKGAWACIVTFPLYEALTGGTNKYGTLTLSKPMVRQMLAVYKYIFPDIDTPNAYSRLASLPTAPRMSGLLSASGHVAQRMNEVLDQLPNPDPALAMQIATDVSWLDIVSDKQAFDDTNLLMQARQWHMPPPAGTGQAQATNAAVAPAAPSGPKASELAAQAAQLRRSQPAELPPMPAAQPPAYAPAPAPIQMQARSLPQAPGAGVDVNTYLANQNRHTQAQYAPPQQYVPPQYAQTPMQPPNAVRVVNHHLKGVPYWVDANDMYIGPAPAMPMMGYPQGMLPQQQSPVMYQNPGMMPPPMTGYPMGMPMVGMGHPQQAQMYNPQAPMGYNGMFAPASAPQGPQQFGLSPAASPLVAGPIGMPSY